MYVVGSDHSTWFVSWILKQFGLTNTRLTYPEWVNHAYSRDRRINEDRTLLYGADNNMSEYDFTRISGNCLYSDRCRAGLDPL